MHPSLFVAAALVAIAVAADPASGQLLPPERQFTYQGLLEQDGQPYTGLADLRFRLLDTETGTSGVFIGVHENVSIEDGLINLTLELPEPLPAQASYVGVEVASPPGSSFVKLLPNQRIHPTPAAGQALGARVEPDGAVSFVRDPAFFSLVSQQQFDAFARESMAFQTFSVTRPTAVNDVDVRVSAVPGTVGTTVVSRFTIYEGEEDEGPIVVQAVNEPFDLFSSGFLGAVFDTYVELDPSKTYTVGIELLEDGVNPIQVDWAVGTGNPYSGGSFSNGPPDTDLVIGIGIVRPGGAARAGADADGTLFGNGLMVDTSDDAVLSLTSFRKARIDMTSRQGPEPQLRLELEEQFDGGNLLIRTDRDQGDGLQDQIAISPTGRVRLNPNAIVGDESDLGFSDLVIEGAAPWLALAADNTEGGDILFQRYESGGARSLVDQWKVGQPFGGNALRLSYSDTGVNGGVSRLWIRPDGRVGLNTSSPLARLHANDGGVLDVSAISNEDVIIQDDDSVLGLFSTPAGDFGSALTLGQLNGTGGISNQWSIVRQTTSAGDDLQFRFGTNTQYALNPVAVSFGTNGSIAQPSSAHLKDNVASIRDALDTILAMRGVTYTWKNTGDADLGFIAEEMAVVLPEIVSFHEGKPTGIEYGRVTALLVEAVKAQQADLLTQRQSLDAVLGRLDRLEKRLDATDVSEVSKN